MQNNHIIVDLDGTMFDIGHRLHHLQARDWDAANALIPDDPCHEDVAKLIRALAHTCKIIVLSSRNESTREMTRLCLEKHKIPVDHVILRPDNDYSQDQELKLKQLADYYGSHEEGLKKVWFILEDRDRVVEAYRNAGYSVFQVRQGTY